MEGSQLKEFQKASTRPSPEGPFWEVGSSDSMPALVVHPRLLSSFSVCFHKSQPERKLNGAANLSPQSQGPPRRYCPPRSVYRQDSFTACRQDSGLQLHHGGIR